MKALGIDIGGSGVKAALVDTATGHLLTPVAKMVNDHQVSPAGLVEIVHSLARSWQWDGQIGVGFPGLLGGATVRKAVNLHPGFPGTDFQAALRASLGPDVFLLNDADAAGLAEAAFGAGRGVSGSMLMLTFGTGIGSALVIGQHLYPNTEFGLLSIQDKPAQHFVSAAAKERRKLSYAAWAGEVNAYLITLDELINPDLIVVGGAISADHARWFHHLTLPTLVVPAAFRNEAGIVGAALFASRASRTDGGPE